MKLIKTGRLLVFLIIVSIGLLSSCQNGQQINNKRHQSKPEKKIEEYQDMNSLVSAIAEKNRVECVVTGFAGTPSIIYEKFEELVKKATKQELIELTNHDSLAVIAYSSYGLIDRELIEPSELLQRFIDDEKSVSTLCGCLMDRETLSSLIYHRYWGNRIEYPDKGNYKKRTINDSKDLQKMDSLILYSKNPDWTLSSRVFENRIYSDGYKSKIEEWAFEKNDFYALEYVFKNLREGNEEKLVESFNKYINNEENYLVQKTEITQMKSEIEDRY